MFLFFIVTVGCHRVPEEELDEEENDDEENNEDEKENDDENEEGSLGKRVVQYNGNAANLIPTN